MSLQTMSDQASEELLPIASFGSQSSSHIPFLRSSLMFQIESLKELTSKMDSYTGLTFTEKFELRRRLWNTYKMADIEDLEHFIECQFESLSELQFSYIRKFYTPFMNHAIPIVILSSALAEALINAIVATGLIETNKSKFFAIFDRLDLREKWRLGPSLFDENLDLDFGSHHFENLKRLLQLRNAFVHSKIDITTTDGKDRIKGTSHHKIGVDLDSRRALFELGSLPDHLFDLIVASISDLSMRSRIEHAGFRFSV